MKHLPHLRIFDLQVPTTALSKPEIHALMKFSANNNEDKNEPGISKPQITREHYEQVCIDIDGGNHHE